MELPGSRKAGTTEMESAFSLLFSFLAISILERIESKFFEVLKYFFPLVFIVSVSFIALANFVAPVSL